MFSEKDSVADIKFHVESNNCEQRLDSAELEWTNLEVGGIGLQSKIIKGVSGNVKPGSLMAIMGSSGAGKSTLMNVIAGRNLGNLEINGNITVNGIPIGDKMPNLSAYVQQNDIFVGSLTVSEHLAFHTVRDLRYSEY